MIFFLLSTPPSSKLISIRLSSTYIFLLNRNAWNGNYAINCTFSYQLKFGKAPPCYLMHVGFYEPENPRLLIFKIFKNLVQVYWDKSSKLPLPVAV
jgi:hypothetical protein